MRPSRLVLSGWCAMLLIAATGCVIPMPIEAEPVEQNLPPFYIESAVSPPASQIVVFDPEFETELELRTGPIGDPNPDDRIFYRWFINYQPLPSTPLYDFSPPGGVGLAELVDGSIDFSLEPCRLLAGDDNDVVDVIIADRPFVGDDDDSPTPKQTVPAGAFKVRISWFIRFDRARCPSS